MRRGADAGHLPDPWLLAPAIAAYLLLAVALRDPILAPTCAIAVLASYVHRRSLPAVPRHAWVVVAVAATLTVYIMVIRAGKGLSAVNRMVPYSEHLVVFSGLLLAVGLVWLWHIRVAPRHKPGLILAAAAVMAVMSGNYYGPGRGYTIAMAVYFSAVIVASAMSGIDARTPRREQWLRAAVCLGLLGVLGPGTWVTALGLRAAERGLLGVSIGGLGLPLPIFTGLGRGNGIRVQTQVKVRQSSQLVATIDGSTPGYLRTQVMASYADGHWRARGGDGAALAPEGGAPGRYRVGETTTGQVESRSVNMQVDLGGAVPMPYGAVTLATDDPVDLSVEPHSAVVRADPPGSLESYTVGSSTDASAQPDAAPIAITAPDPVLAQLRPLATQVAAGAATPLEAATRVESWFHDHYEYSLDVDLARDGDPVVDFVLNRRPAYCEHFASGMALMLLALDIPARVVGGFSVEERSVVTGEWLVRQRDAHAWTEVYDAASASWVRFDATPPGETAPRGAGGIGGWIRQAGEALLGVPRELAAWWTDRDIATRARTALASVAGRSQRNRLGWVALAIAAALVFHRRRSLGRLLRALRRRRPKRATASALERARDAFAQVALALEAGGVPIAPTETLSEYIARTGHDDDLIRFATLYHELRFDPRATTDRLSDLNSLAARVDSRAR